MHPHCFIRLMAPVMTIDPNSIASSGAVALVLSVTFVGMFVTGTVVSGRIYERLLTIVERLTSALETQNRLTAQALSKREDHTN